jgi:molybdenum cofactor synthesis domain-containing protein
METQTNECHTAAVMIIGDEILLGSTNDKNGPCVARRLGSLGIKVCEMRYVGDDIASIVAALRPLHRRYDWVVVAGGLGPTHDDLTAQGVANAFNVSLVEHPLALASLRNYHDPSPVPAGRLPAVNLPAGCEVLPDMISGACGFKLHNVFVLPGQPEVMAQLLELATTQIAGGPPLLESSLRAPLLEHEIASPLREVQTRHPRVAIGSYPYFQPEGVFVNLVIRSKDKVALEHCRSELSELLKKLMDRGSDLVSH